MLAEEIVTMHKEIDMQPVPPSKVQATGMNLVNVCLQVKQPKGEAYNLEFANSNRISITGLLTIGNTNYHVDFGDHEPDFLCPQPGFGKVDLGILCRSVPEKMDSSEYLTERLLKVLERVRISGTKVDPKIELELLFNNQNIRGRLLQKK